jgi:DNA repair and recombination protein RAD52
MTKFDEKQLAALSAPLSAVHVKQREQSGRKLSYVEGWHGIAEANRIFGFDGWTRETVEIHCVSEGPREIGKAKIPGHGVTYTAKVRVCVGNIVREGTGAGHGIDRDLGLAHESAIKEAETDAMKRALMTFGNPFGLALYDKDQANVSSEADDSRAQFMAECRTRIKNFADAKELVAWWGSDEQKKARRDFDLDHNQVDELKVFVIARREALTKKAA